MLDAAIERFARPKAWIQPALLVGSLIPFGVLGYRALIGDLGANPIATVLNQLGLLALIFLLASLAATPLKLLFGWTWALRVRKTLGLFAFFSALAHFAVYVVLDQALMLAMIVGEIAKRPFILFGLAALGLLLPLALTSSKDSPKRLGFRRWQRIHYLVYPAAILACVHFFLRVKADVSEPLVYAALCALLLGVRVVSKLRQRAC